jgi:hypothetical protein
MDCKKIRVIIIPFDYLVKSKLSTTCSSIYPLLHFDKFFLPRLPRPTIPVLNKVNPHKAPKLKLPFHSAEIAAASKFIIDQDFAHPQP